MKMLTKMSLLTIALHFGASMQAAAWAVSTAPITAVTPSASATTTSTSGTTAQEVATNDARLAATKARVEALNNNKILATKEGRGILNAVKKAHTALLPDLTKEVALYASCPWFTQKIKNVQGAFIACPALGIACTPDGKLAIANYRGVSFFNPDTFEITDNRYAFRYTPLSITYTSQGTRIGLFIDDRFVNKIIFFNSDGSECAVWGNFKHVTSIACVTNGVLAVGFNSAGNAGVKFFNLNSTSAGITCTIHERVLSLACSPDGILAVGLESGSIIFLNPDGTERSRWRGNGHRVQALAYSADGILAAGLEGGSVVLLNKDGDVYNTWKNDFGIAYPKNLAWLPNNMLAVELSGNYCRLLQPSDEPLDHQQSQDACKRVSDTSTTSTTSIGKRELASLVVTGSTANTNDDVARIVVALKHLKRRQQSQDPCKNASETASTPTAAV